MWIRRLWKRFLVWRAKQRRASPAYIGALALDVAHLTALAECAVLPEQSLAPLSVLREEMLALAKITASTEFAGLPQERRLALAMRLERSRRFVIATMQEGTPPTPRVQ